MTTVIWVSCGMASYIRGANLVLKFHLLGWCLRAAYIHISPGDGACMQGCRDTCVVITFSYAPKIKKTSSLFSV